MAVHEGPLGRRYPKHFDHVEKYGLTAAPAVIQPLAPGFNWYTSFDSPRQGEDGNFYLPERRLGTIRGGHCICACPPSMLVKDTEHDWRFYNQQAEGACEGFGHSRRYSLLYGKTFDAFHLYDDGQRIEGTYVRGESRGDGTTNDALCQALAKWGVHPQDGEEAHRVDVRTEHGKVVHALSYEWATTVDQILAALGITDGGPIPLLNSWGTDYPHVVKMPPETMARLLREGGECDVLTDRV